MNVEAVLNELDKAVNENRGAEIEGLLTSAIHTAMDEGDNGALLQLLNELLGFYRETGRTEDSYQIADSILSVAEHMGLEGSLPYATSLLNIANAYRAGGRLVESLEFYVRVEEMYKTMLPSDSVLMASFYNNKSLLLQEMGNLEESVNTLKKAFEIVEKHNEPFEIAVTHANLANSYIGLGDLDNAYKHALSSKEAFENTGLKDSHYASALYALGMCLNDSGKTGEAQKVLTTARDIMEETLGRNEFYYRICDELKRCEISDTISACSKKSVAANGGVNIDSGESNGDSAVDSDGKNISGMEFARHIYEDELKPAIERELPEYIDKITVALVGRGSDCYGWDDEQSKDHDWGGLCVILEKEAYDQIGQKLSEIYEALPKTYENAAIAPMVSGHKRRGVFEIEDFFKELLGKWPITNNDRYVIPDYAFSTCVNGKIFTDPTGQFTEIRENLKKGHPLGVLYLKLAESAAGFSQKAQYNCSRMLKRGDRFTAEMMLYEGLKDALTLAHHIDGVYPPHDKWLYKSAGTLSFASELMPLIDARDVAGIGKLLAYKLYEKGYISDIDDYLDHHTEELLFKHRSADKTVEELAEEVTKLEFTAFDKVKNEGGRASCQDDYSTFEIMRKSQYLTWTHEMLLQYLYDFDREYRLGHNLITEKYGRMMASTAPERYEEIKDSFPAISEEKAKIIDAVVAMQVNRMEEFASEFPGLAGNARSVHTYEDNEYNTSSETYLRGEISTYSDKMLELYARYIIDLENKGQSVTKLTMLNSVKMYGYASLEEAENALK